MDRGARVLIMAWSAEHLEELEGELCLIPDLKVARHLLSTEMGLISIVRAQIQQQRPDFLLYALGPGDSNNELRELSLIPGPIRPASQVLVTPGDVVDVDQLRLAMNAGFRDCLIHGDIHTRLPDMFRNLVRERRATIEVKNRVTAFVGAKGGVGCSTLAASVGHVLSTHLQQKTLLLDLDGQFGTQYLSHDLEPTKGLKEALEHIDTLDTVALQGYIQKTPTGLSILGFVPSQTLISGEIEPERMIRLLDLLTGEFENLILDMPRQIDILYGAIIERVTRLVLVVRQELSSVRHGSKLIGLLERELDLPRNVISLVVNFHDPDEPISTEDINRILNLELLGAIRRDDESVGVANNLGLPLGLHAPGSHSQRAIERISHALVGREGLDNQEKNLVRRVLQQLRMGR
jgi:pilus assembly protein CpaE